MKNLVLLIAIPCMLFSCKPNCPETKIPDPVIVKDTVYVDLEYKAKNDSLELVISKMQFQKDSIDLLNNRLATELMNERLVIQNAKYYVNIVNKNRSQEKFLLGWMNRALKN